MQSKTNEQALEATIEKQLTGTTLEAIKAEGLTIDGVNESGEMYPAGNGYFIGQAQNFNTQFAIDEAFFWQFLETTQKVELEKIKRQSDWKLKILNRFDRMVKKYGILHLLKKGLGVDDAHFTLFYVLPLASSSKAVKERFEQNSFSVTRQLRYSADNPREEIDMVLFVNGLPLVTMELKNHWTGQNAKVHGQQQYKTQRDTNQPLLQFARSIVHFAVDTDEAYMTTKLNGRDTFFLPFNKGNNHGKGNPPNPFGHKTAYLWEEVFTRKSLANIIQHFVRMDGSKKEALNSRTLFFPRYHQMNVVRDILGHASKNGVGQTYLIQHSAGSGKSNSITWAAYQLIETYPEQENTPGSKGIDQPLFDSVIVVTDRRLLDKQLRENIKEFSEVKNIVSPAYSSKELRESLEQGKKIIITTIQKFPFIIDGMADLSDKRFAVIIDEAHSSQSGTAHDKMNQAMGQQADPDEVDVQDKIILAMQARKMRGNASYMAFTATPKAITLEKFGMAEEDGSFKPFHLYSMKQAIEEGFILDVLANYTTLKSYYEIEKSIEDNPLFDTAKAQKKLRAFVEQHQQTIHTKAEIVLDHFIPHIVNQKRLKGKAKAMVVTQSIESAIKYYKALTTILEAKGHPFKIIIAFSGTKTLNGIDYSEAEMNGFGDKDTSDKFDEDEYRMLIVANKYLTGFDQPKLCAMYVDKKLQGVMAVQALSRLNRSANKLGKKTEDLFILDFFNSTEDIKTSFDPFYTATSLSQATDVNVLHELKDVLDEVGVYEWEEVENFNELFFQKVDAQLLSPIIDTAAERFKTELELEDEEKADFKIKAKQFVKIYGQMASILPFEVVQWEKLFWFLKFLVPKLPISDTNVDGMDELLESVDLSTYGLERVKLNHSIGLEDSDSELDPQNPSPRGAYGGEEERDPLELIIQSFNERWFQGWEATPDDQRLKFISLSKSIQAHPDFQTKVAENHDEQNKDLAFRKILDDVMSKQRKQELDLYRLYAKDESFYQAFFDTMKRMASVGK
ncbi:type I restriction endonuclease subunit R [Subsaximicrobium wynnwilliamsii]|uniref:Type I restriction endonuclease subunit R n=1 Tax=Subsaximicrobium wynnwilliamsii TaxID=291179 RepID=A0A5C6ZJP0_9FLAO|nr:type I restriction endonuclease subunit R [Subsaximicrobium wynnwilliamsii]TXD83116.1 type I restriction endonuclease subunit R [Subsaximicrobium wynnwilliamsii]TXD88860.1 type I restriction endonuclease subunit R [Subsaximicrobium wynnwilliamsii]TXE02933.1 type I restriction endonuclease subunit R [Subsaximicrobium wynnwilliamsii]